MVAESVSYSHDPIDPIDPIQYSDREKNHALRKSVIRGITRGITLFVVKKQQIPLVVLENWCFSIKDLSFYRINRIVEKENF